MSAVKATIVKDIDSREGKTPGAIEYTTDKRGHYDGIFYRCPCGCGLSRFLAFSGEKPWWKWNGDREKPTLEPSIHHNMDGRTHWHGWLRNGEFVKA